MLQEICPKGLIGSIMRCRRAQVHDGSGSFEEKKTEGSGNRF